MKQRDQAARFPLNNVAWLLALLFHEAAAGVQISGDSGAGKSVAMEGIARALARHVPFMLIDPHGSTAERVYRNCLDLGPSIAARTLYIKPSDTRAVVSINPLAVAGAHGDGLRGAAARTAKVEHVSKILLSAWGERDFNSKPVMFKNVYRILNTLAFAGLSIADAKLFLDTASPIYRSMLRAVPDLLHQHEMEELPEMRPIDRESQIGSAKNRFLGFLSNPIIEATLGKVHGALNVEQLYRQGCIVIVNLERGGVLREQDQEILANLWLTDIVHCVLSQPAGRRRPYFVMIDELPVFKSSAPLLIDALAQIRKFQLRVVAAHQGTNMFPERQTDDQLLHAFVGQCRVHLYFRHGNPTDAEFFGRIVELPSLDLLKVKHEHWDKEQIQSGHDLVTLVDRGESQTATQQEGGGETSGTTESDTATDSTSTSHTASDSRQSDATALRDAVTHANAHGTGSASTVGHSTASTQSATSSWSKSTANGTTRTFKQTLVPRMTWRDVLRAVQFFTADEQFLMAASRLASLRTGHAIMHVSGRGATWVAFPYTGDPYARSRRFGDRVQEGHRRLLMARPDHDTVEAIEEHRRMVLEALLREINKLGHGQVLDAPVILDCSVVADQPRLALPGGVGGTSVVRRIEDTSTEADHVPWNI